MRMETSYNPDPALTHVFVANPAVPSGTTCPP